MTGLITVSSKNQITLPAKLARELNLKKGSKLWVKTKGEVIELEKAEDSWEDLQGILANTSMAKKHTVLEAIEIGKQREAERLRKKFEKYAK